jgi:cell division transport system permease protein
MSRNNSTSRPKLKKGNRLGYYLKEGFGSVFTHGFMSFASICVIVACLLIMGSFALVAINVNEIIGSIEDENVILAFVDDSLSEDQARALQSQILSVDNVSSCEFVSRDEALDSFVSKYDSSSLFDDLDSSVLRDRYVVYMDDISELSQTQSALSNISGIALVNANSTIAKGLMTMRNIVSIITLVLAVILVGVSLFIMSNTIKLTTVERKDEIAIMKMVGATNSFIRWPFVVEGFILGVVGALVGFLLECGIYSLVLTKLTTYYTMTFISIVPLSVVTIPMLICFLAIGFVIGVIGSAVAIKNYLKV